MAQIVPVQQPAWAPTPSDNHELAVALERGDLLFFPQLRFEIFPSERSLFSAVTGGRAKNISFDACSGRLGGTTLRGAEGETLRAMLERFSRLAASLVDRILPPYRPRATTARGSFRPTEIAGRATSWRKDDTRLHVDAFPATPVHGRRILRVFSNVNPVERSRVWRVGGDFEEIVRQFSPRLRIPFRAKHELYRLLRITKSRRSAYDALMLQLHDLMKADHQYQAESPQTRIEFPAGTTWMAFTDQVSHAAMSGQYQLEQTFLVPVDALLDQARSPLGILERFTHRLLT